MMIDKELNEVFDEFQSEAVNSIVKDFSKKKNGRYLLVIPTGGGKTRTAVKAINRLFETGILNPRSDFVLWVTHRIELENQAKDAFSDYGVNDDNLVSFKDRVSYVHDLKKIGSVVAQPEFAFVVIDEAHHSKASSYQPIFENDTVGVLGLTATPSRHDGRALDFERESYSIGFPDLIKKRIILDPIDEPPIVSGYTDNAGDLDDVDKEKLNNQERNRRIISVLHERSSKYNKVVIYVGTRNHVKDLYEQITNSALVNVYPSINWILGGTANNSRGIDRKEFIEVEKSQERSILINVDVLTEGYDDKTIDTVVLACPMKSTLKCMQAVGRAVRRFGDKKAYVVEVEDTLPNVRYRFSNRWLYSDISDSLEPQVIDQIYFDDDTFRESLACIYSSPDTWVEEVDRIYPDYDEEDRYSVILFKVYRGSLPPKHIPVVLSDANRFQFKQRFNFLSERLAHESKAHGRNVDWAFSKPMWSMVGGPDDDNDRNNVWDAMKFSGQCISNSPKPANPRYAELKPWISFVAFRFKAPEISSELLEFVSKMVNKELLIQDIKNKNYEPESKLIKLPMPLGECKGLILRDSTFARIENMITQLQILREQYASEDHINQLNQFMINEELPIELRYKECLPIIVREELDYFREL